MSIVRIKKERNFVQINKEMLEEQELSLKAKGLISFCLTKPDDWQFHIQHLASVLKEGERSIRSALNEAISAGYAFRYQTRKENGDFGPWEIVITDSKETLAKYKESILSTGKIEIIFTERRFALAQVADAQNSRLLILDKSDIDYTDKPSLPPNPEKKKGGLSFKKEWEFLKDIQIEDRDKQRLMERYSVDLVKRVVDYVQAPDFKLDKTLDAAIFWYVKYPEQMKAKQESPKPNLAEMNAYKADLFAYTNRHYPKAPEMFSNYIHFKVTNQKVRFDDPNFDKSFEFQKQQHEEFMKSNTQA